MSGRGHQIFVDELQRFADRVADARCAAIADRLTTPLRVAVSGRRGVGCGTVAHALARAGELRPTITVTTSKDADVDVYVIVEVVKPEDRGAIATAGRPVLAVLNKADLTGPSAAGLAGLPAVPMVGMLAVAALDDLVDDALWAALRVMASQPAELNSPDSFVAAEHPVPVEVRRRLLDTLDLFGIRQAVAAIRRGATRAETYALLRRLSCIDDVVAKIESLGAQVHYRRLLEAIAELETLAVTVQRVSGFLSHDDTVVARMMAAVDVVDADGGNVDRCDSAAAHLARAVAWQRHSRGPGAGVHRACGADIVRGSLRLWSKTGRSA